MQSEGSPASVYAYVACSPAQRFNLNNKIVLSVSLHIIVMIHFCVILHNFQLPAQSFIPFARFQPLVFIIKKIEQATMPFSWHESCEKMLHRGTEIEKSNDHQMKKIRYISHRETCFDLPV